MSGIPRIRPARPADIDVLVHFQQAMATETEDKGLDAVKLRKGIEYLLEHPAEGHYLIAERDNAPAGSLMVTFEWSDWRCGRFWWIQSVYMAPEHRRQGVYSALHRAILDEARSDPRACGIRLYVERENVGAQATYESLGMAETVYRLYEETF